MEAKEVMEDNKDKEEDIGAVEMVGEGEEEEGGEGEEEAEEGGEEVEEEGE